MAEQLTGRQAELAKLGLEPSAAATSTPSQYRTPFQLEAETSAAISLKRIADRLDWLASQPKQSIFEQAFGAPV